MSILTLIVVFTDFSIFSTGFLIFIILRVALGGTGYH